MKKYISILILFICLFQTASAAVRFEKSLNHLHILQDGEHKDKCPECGMKLSVFGKTNHAVKLRNGKYLQFCSIRDLIKAEREKGLPVKDYLAIDSKKEKFMDAKKMWYVVGSSIKGTMSTVSKIAFINKNDALDFKENYGGELMTFTKTKKVSEKILDIDIKTINRKNCAYF